MIQRFSKAAAVAACLASAAVITPALAAADAADDQFLGAVAAQGITGQPDQLISFAHSMCGAVGGMGAIGPFYRLMASQSLSPQQASAVFAAGAAAYCPDKQSLFDRLPAPSP